MSDILTQDDYKRFEELLKEMVLEQEDKRIKKYWGEEFSCGDPFRDQLAIKRTLELIKERQNLTLKDGSPQRDFTADNK